jgi:signal transduction histidine kinase
MFDSWGSFVTFLESAQGNFYYIALLLLLLAAASIALQTRSKPQALDWRINLAIGSLLGLRLILAAAFGFFWFTGLSMPAAVAPVERTVHLVGILLFSWIWSRQEKENGTSQAIIAIATLGVLGLFLYITLPWMDVPAGTTFNYTGLDYAWSAVCLLYLAAGSWAIFKRAQPESRFGLIQMGVLFLGQLLHLVLAEPVGNLPLATEVFNLIAIPFLFFLQVKEEKKEVHPETAAFFPTETPVYEVPLNESASEPPILSPEVDDLARQTAKDLRADVCAFASLDEYQGEIQIHGGYNALLETTVELATFSRGELPNLATALISGQSFRLSSDQKMKDLDNLAQLLKLSLPGNVLASPIPNSRDERIWFVVLVRMQKPWQLKEEVNLERTSGELTHSLIQALGYLDQEIYAPEPMPEEFEKIEPLQDESTPFEPVLDEPLSHFLDEQQRLQEENERYKQDVARLIAHIDELKEQQGSDGHLLAQGEMVAALQAENEQLKKAVNSLDAGRSTARPINIAVEQAKEELRLALMQVSVLQEKLETAQSSFAKNVPPALQGKKITGDQVEVIASIAQELRQPLSSVLGYTDLLLSESVGIIGALQRKFLERVRSSSERMNALISDLIRIAELDQAGFSSLRKTVELSAVIDDAIGQLRTQMQEKRIVMRVDLPSQLPELNTDRDALQQILHHLLQNADSATPPEGTITLRAVVDSQPEFGEFVLLQVSDTGGGISDVDLPRVFSRMYRNTNPLIKGIGDTGVGLTIAETLTQALGGRIWVESEQGVGATFSVLLPLQPQKANLIAEKQPG